MSVEKSNTDYGERGTGGQVPEQRDVPTSRGNENTTNAGQRIVTETRDQISKVVPDIVKK